MKLVELFKKVNPYESKIFQPYVIAEIGVNWDGDFELAKETSTGVSSTPSQSGGTMDALTNNKTVMWLGLIVVGYFAYKYYYKK